MIQSTKKILFVLMGVCSILITGLYIYITLNHSTYKKGLIEMKNNNQLHISISSQIEHKTLLYNDYTIHYYVSGQKHSDLILFLHPAFSDHHAFDQQIDNFSKNYCVISIDMIGHGLSQANQSSDQIDKSAQHIQKIIDSEGFKNAHLVGVSLGSLVAQHYAFQYPNSVKSLTILGGYDINKNDKAVAKSQTLVQVGLILRAVFSMKAFRQKTAEVSCFSERGSALFYETAKHFTRRSFKVMAGVKHIVKNRKSSQQVIPTLILTGEHDIDLAKKMAKSWHSYHTNSQYFCIENAGHCANMDKPKIFNKIVADFIHNNTTDQGNYF